MSAFTPVWGTFEAFYLYHTAITKGDGLLFISNEGLTRADSVPRLQPDL